jgi:N-dimethylarginine dimethylaminohydrolase
MVRLLMCPPRAHADRPLAVRQWERLIELLGVAGEVKIERIEPQGGHGGDIAFTASSALISGSLAIMSSSRSRAEQASYRSWLASNGYATTALGQCQFEGSADALFDRVRPYLYVGYGGRTERSATIALAELVDARIVPLRLIDERFAHLHSALCPLASGHVLFYPDAFSPPTQRLIRGAVEADALIELSAEDALAFACSPIEIGDALIMGEVSRLLRSRLQFAGYRIFSTDLSEFAGVGGVPRALTLRLDDGPACGVAAA